MIGRRSAVAFGIWMLAASAAFAQIDIQIGSGHKQEEPARRGGPSITGILGGALSAKDALDRKHNGILCAVIFDDADGNGLRGAAEGTLAGWSFHISDSTGNPVTEGITDAKGRFCTEKPVPPGSYTLRETGQPGWTGTDPAGGSFEKPATATAGRTTEILFGNCRGEHCGGHSVVAAGPVVKPAGGMFPSGALCVRKYNDLDGNGAFTPGEPPLAGVSFEFRASGGVVVATGVTDANGQFCADLPDGTYMAFETVPPGWINTDPGGFPTKGGVVQLGTFPTLMFGNRQPPPPPGQICVTKYSDLNGNGMRDSGEPALPNWQFLVLNAGYVLLTSGTTDASGQFCTAKTLAAGVYHVDETVQSGWTSTDPPPGSTKTAVVAPGQTTQVLYGNHQNLPPPGKICVTKYNDLNGNGIRDGGEPPLPNWQFAIRDSANAVVANGLTHVSGQFCTAQTLAAGTYTVGETLQPGWVQTDPSGGIKTVVLAAGQTAQILFGNRQGPPPQFCVIKYNDLNGDAHRQASEPPLAGVTFSVGTPGGYSQVTDANGRACFPVIPPVSGSGSTVSVYTVFEHVQGGWTNTQPGGAIPQTTFTLTDGQTPPLLEFGNRVTPPPGRICVTKYNDLNGNGVRDSGEPGLPAWQFTIRNSGGAAVVQGSTNTQGRAIGDYCTDADLPPGNYSAVETPQPGWTSTDPGGTAPAKPVTVIAGQTALVAFGNKVPPPPQPGGICLTKYNDLNGDGAQNSGEPELANWQFTIRNAANVIVAQGVTNAVGEFCSGAKLTLPPGVYSVTETLQPGWTSTDPGGASPSKTATVTSNIMAQLLFGNRQNPPPPGRICLSKYNDLNGNGTRDTGEPGLAGWQFTIRNAAGAIVAQGVTDIQGGFCTAKPGSLPPGSYTVSETAQANWTSTDPGGTLPQKTVVVATGQTVQVAFGNHAAPSQASLEMEKFLNQTCTGATNQCIFRIRIFNAGPGAFSGVLGFTDMVTFLGNVTGGVFVSLTAAPPGWTCTSLTQPMTCTSNAPITLAQYQFADVIYTMKITGVVPPVRNCAQFTGASPPPAACVIIP